MKDAIEFHEEYKVKRVHDAYDYVVQRSLLTAKGKAWLDAACVKLREDFAAGKFNTISALKLFERTVEKAFCDDTGWGKAVLGEIRESGIVNKLAREILKQFKESTGAFDQRPERNGLAALIWGK